MFAVLEDCSLGLRVLPSTKGQRVLSPTMGLRVLLPTKGQRCLTTHQRSEMSFHLPKDTGSYHPPKVTGEMVIVRWKDSHLDAGVKGSRDGQLELEHDTYIHFTTIANMNFVQLSKNLLQGL